MSRSFHFVPNFHSYCLEGGNWSHLRADALQTRQQFARSNLLRRRTTRHGLRGVPTLVKLGVSEENIQIEHFAGY